MLKSFCSSSKTLLPLVSAASLLSACNGDTPETTGKDPSITISLGSPTTTSPQPTNENTPTSPTQPTTSSGVGGTAPGQNLNGDTTTKPPSGSNDSGSNSGTGGGGGNAGQPIPSEPQQPAQPSTGNPTPKLATLTISINELRNTSGNFCLSMFASADGFPDSAEKAVLAECFTVSDRSFNVTIKDVPAGRYAIAGWHDENKDKKLNYNLFGIPKEGLAFSENGKPRLAPPPGPPSFDSIAFTVTDADRATPMKTSYLLDLL